MALAVVGYKIGSETIRKMAPLLLLLTLILMALVFVPGLGFRAGGAQRWINIGSVTLQPSEFLKLTFILYLASWLTAKTESAGGKKNKKKEFGETLLPFFVVVGAVGVFLIAQPDISTFGIIGLTAFILYFFSDTPLRHSFLTVAIGAICLMALVWLEPYRVDRFMSWLFPEMDPMGSSFQPNQALITAGSGGAFGQGFGSSSLTAAHIPELIGDSIFAPYAMETGFAGCLILVLLFGFFFWRGFRIAKQTEDKFTRLTALGITFWIAVQTFINISSTIRLIPLSGVPLPFVSYGGSAILAELAAVGILLNASRHVV